MKGIMTMKKMMMVVAATVAAWCSWGAESISVDKVSNHYPWDGKVDCVYTLSGAAVDCTYKGVFTLSVEKDGATVSKVVTNDVTAANGTYTNTFDCTTLFGAGYYPNGGVAVSLVKKPAGVQLWANGPYFATCNVGATRPQDAGYYFWWGDTGGYKRNTNNDGWISLQDGTAYLFAETNCPTMSVKVAELKNKCWINENGDLVAAHDAATVHRGTPWRMPTYVEFQRLTNYCTSTWTNNWNGTGIAGSVVTGVTAGYTDKSIFLPAVGWGDGDKLKAYNGDLVYYPASTVSLNYYARICYLYLYTKSFSAGEVSVPHNGRPIRPVRSAE